MEKKNVLSGLVGAIKKAAIDGGCRDNVPDELVDKTILKELKTVNEQIDTCPSDRTELIEKYTFAKNVILEDYLRFNVLLQTTLIGVIQTFTAPNPSWELVKQI